VCLSYLLRHSDPPLPNSLKRSSVCLQPAQCAIPYGLPSLHQPLPTSWSTHSDVDLHQALVAAQFFPSLTSTHAKY